MGEQSSKGMGRKMWLSGRGSAVSLTAGVRETSMSPGCPGAPKCQRLLQPDFGHDHSGNRCYGPRLGETSYTSGRPVRTDMTHGPMSFL